MNEITSPSQTTKPSQPIWAWVAVVFVFLISIVSAWAVILSSQSTSGPGVLPIVWPAGGIVLGLALIRSQWGYAYIASSMIGLLTGAILMDISMLSVATPIAIVRSAEIFLSWMMLKGVVSQHKNLGHPAVLLRFVLTAVAGGPLLSGIVASTMMHWEAGVSWAGFLLN